MHVEIWGVVSFLKKKYSLKNLVRQLDVLLLTKFSLDSISPVQCHPSHDSHNDIHGLLSYLPHSFEYPYRIAGEHSWDASKGIVPEW